MKAKPMVAMIVFGSLMVFGALAPREATAGQKSIVGSWIVDGTPDQPGPPPFRALATFTSDGTLVQTDPEFGGGHGVWKRGRGRESTSKFIILIPPGHPFGQGTITVTAAGTVDHDGDTATAAFTTVVDATNVQTTFTGTVVLTRITLGP